MSCRIAFERAIEDRCCSLLGEANLVEECSPPLHDVLVEEHSEELLLFKPAAVIIAEEDVTVDGDGRITL